MCPFVAHCSPLLHCVRLTFLCTKDDSFTRIQIPSIPHWRPWSFSLIKIMAHLSVIFSSFAVCITTIKFVVPASRLYYEYVRDLESTPELKLWLDTGMSAIFTILSWLLLAFSLSRLENGLQIILSLGEASLIVYQGGYLSLYCVNCPPWLQRALLIFFTMPMITIALALVVMGYTKASKIMLLAFFLAEYIGIFVAYLVVFTLGSFPYVKVFFWWNMGLCCVAWAGALGSLLAHLMDQLDFITLLWIDNATSMVWVLWVLWKQWTTMQKVRSHGENKKLNVLKQNGFWSRIP